MEDSHPRVQATGGFIGGGTISVIVSPDAPVTVNEEGGAQSDVPVRFDLIDAKAMFEMAKVLDHGAKKYGADNWRRIPVQDHLNHLLMHTYAYLAGDESDDHLSHILCRATFALGVKLGDDVHTKMEVKEERPLERHRYILDQFSGTTKCSYCGLPDLHGIHTL